ncbi:hypothetical protein CsSME_00026623 [Camellia sinensis var. sinensis]|uniref:uncharacterized protein LOC114282736 isoform X1 n=1 Tax=Camellia sinensis TaxID=4442 RepID=UPI0010368235|nr:uncharacterized protein LOC114282736 isoform X1 [Camellia sinensis]
MNLLRILMIISSILSISIASCNPDHGADELATQLNHDECVAELGEFSSSLSLDPPNTNGQSSDTSSSAIVHHDSSASTSFSDCEQVRGDQPPITTVAAAQDLCLESGTSDNEDGEELLKRGQASQQDSTGRMETRTRALDLGWTFLGLTFQALLCLAIFHFQAPSRALDLGWTFLGLAFQALLCLAIFHFQAPSTPTSTSTLSFFSMWFYLIGAAMLMIAMPLRNAYPTVARIGEQIGMFSVAFGFLMMTGILLPHRLNCFVLPVAGDLLFLGFVFARANMRQRRYPSV